MKRRAPITLGLIGATLAVSLLGAVPVSADEPPAVTETAMYVQWGDTAPLLGQNVAVHADFAPAEPGQTIQLERYDADLNVWVPGATGQVGEIRYDDIGSPVASFDAHVPTYTRGVTVWRIVAQPHGNIPVAISSPTPVFVGGQSRQVTTRYSAGRAVVGTPIKVSGRAIRVPEGEPVVLQRRVGEDRWTKVDSGLTQSRGRFSLTIASKILGTSTFRVVVPGRADFSSVTKRIVVDETAWTPGTFPPAPPPGPDPGVPEGDPDDYALLYEPTPRWNPCLEIGYRVNAAEGPASAAEDARAAVAEVATATGLRFVYRGPTDLVPGDRSGAAPYPSDTDLVIAWSTDEESTYLPPDPAVAGQGGAAFADAGYVDQDGRPIRMFYKAVLVMNAETTWLTPGFADGSSTGKVLMHELGHVVGLDHAATDDEVMYPTLGAGPSRWGAGDLSGLSLLGSGEGCIYDAKGSVATYDVPPYAAAARIATSH